MLIALGFLALLVVDPLNAGSGSGQRSEQAILRIAAPFYDASDAVTVVLIDDAYLQRVGLAGRCAMANRACCRRGSGARAGVDVRRPAVPAPACTAYQR